MREFRQFPAQGLLLLFSVASAAVIAAVSPVAAQGPLTPTNPLQNPAVNAVSPFNDFTDGSLTAETTYTELIAGPTSFAALEGFLGSEVISSVYEDPTTGYLAFEYQFVNNPATATDMQRMTINDPSNPWTPFTIFDAGADGSGASHSASGGPSPYTWTNGNPYDFEQESLNDGIAIRFASGDEGTVVESASSDSTANVWLTTNAKNYAITDVGLSDSAAVGTSNAYGPAPGVVPEPSTIASALLGAGILLAARRRRRC